MRRSSIKVSRRKSKKKQTTELDNESVHIQPPPLLRVQKKGGVYQIILHPINKFAENENEAPEGPFCFEIPDNSSSSVSRSARSSSSSFEMEYPNSQAMIKPTEKPELAEVGTQWESEDCFVVQNEKKMSSDSKTCSKLKKK